jgi:DNA-binding NarL/FixJ family response regulator
MSPQKNDFHGKCLLLADSDPGPLEAAVRSIGANEVLVASSVVQALALLTSDPPDLILLNTNLGADALSRVRAATDAVMIALLDGDDHNEGTRAMRAGADDYAFTSKITPETLKEIVFRCSPCRGIRRTTGRIRECVRALCALAAGGAG